VKITQSSLKGNILTGKVSGTVTVTNTSGAPLSGPLQLRLDGLAAGVTLDNKTGTQDGAPYITVSGGALAAGASVTATVSFSNPAKAQLTYTPKIFSGTF
jgi:hypothetical protein